jgi:hypothetical protein
MMASSSPHSGRNSGIDLVSSSPLVHNGTSSTIYSPELLRNVVAGPANALVGQYLTGGGEAFAVTDSGLAATIVGGPSHLSANAAGKLPVRDSDTLESSSANEHEPVFLDEVIAAGGDYISRYLIIKKYPESVLQHDEYKEVDTICKGYAAFKNSVPSMLRNIRIKFDNIRDACDGKVIFEQHGFEVDYTTPHDYVMGKYQESDSVNIFEGQVKLTVTITSNSAKTFVILPLQEQELQEITDSARSLLVKFGDVREIQPVAFGRSEYVFRVEFFSLMAAVRSVAALSKESLSDRSASGHISWLFSAENWMEPTPHSGTPVSAISIHPRDEHGHLVGYLRAGPPTGPPAGSHQTLVRHQSDHNRVRRERILDGSDVRTTIMIRNCPNRMDWMDLKEILDKHCFGTYDFIYLRIDFQTACNVGYAFVNFTEMTGVIALLDNIEKRTWGGYRTHKAAEISYATFQGREALVQKFRNSSVMQEASFCRPRVFWSYLEAMNAQGIDGITLVGSEVDFPTPDNPAKLQRSMDSARSHGLYPPHANFAGVDGRHRLALLDRSHRERNQLSPLGVTPEVKRMVQAWYQFKTGQSVYFNGISTQLALQFLNENPWVLSIGSYNAASANVGRPYQQSAMVPYMAGPSAISGSAQLRRGPTFGAGAGGFGY